MSYTITFVPWADPIVDPYGQNPDGDFSRLSWLPTIGPSAWLVWGTLAAQLRLDAAVTWQLEELAVAHGLGSGTSRNAPIRRTLTRLQIFRLAGLLESETETYAVRLTAPPLRRRALHRLPAWAAELQRETFAPLAG
jgi:hypothetical protein